jgi:O-antigen/teichoic acid export membrane protein
VPAEGGGARDGLRSVTRGSLILLLGSLGFVAANFVARVILVRDLSTDEFSEFYIALTLAGLLIALGQLGLPPAIARSIPYAASDEDRRAIVRTSFLVTVPLALAAGAALVLLSLPLAARYGQPVLALTLQYFAVAVVANIVSSQVAAIFQGFEDVRPNTIFAQILNPLLFIGFLVAFFSVGSARFPLGYRGALLAYVLSSVVMLVGMLLYFRLRLPRHLPRGPYRPAAGRKLLLFALPLFAVGLSSYVAGILDTLVLGFFHNGEAGRYGAALPLARLTLVGLGALAYILLPVIARFARDGDREAARVVYGTAVKWMVLTSLPLFLVFLFYPGPALAFVYKAVYAQATLPLQILLVGAFISAAIGPASAAQVAFGQTRALLYNNLAAAATDAVLSLLLIPGYGIVGAAIAWATANALIPILSITELAWTHGVHPFRSSYLIALAGTSIPLAILFTFLPIVPSGLVLVGLVLLVAVVFVAVALAGGGIDEGDRLLLEAIERMIGRPVPGARWIGRRFARRR